MERSETVTEAHRVTREYEQLTGQEISAAKTFTWGWQGLQGKLADIPTHLVDFRCVGGNVQGDKLERQRVVRVDLYD